LFSLATNVKFDDSDIHSLKIINKKNNSRIVSCKLVSLELKNFILKNRKKFNTKLVNKDERESGKIYVNDCLTFYYRSLFYNTKETARAKEYKYVWVKNSNIFVRKKDGDNRVLIRNLKDLESLQ